MMIDRTRVQRRASSLASPGLALALALGLPLGWIGACRSSSAADEEPRGVGWLVAHGEFEEAVRVAARNRERRPRDPKAEEDHRRASVAWLLEQGRQRRLENDDEASLEQFRAALEIAPDDPIVQDWVDVQLEKLAAKWIEQATEWHAQDDLEMAVDCYEKALQFLPESRLGREGLARALLQLNYRAGMGERYYEQGVRSMHELFLEQARWGFSASRKYEPENERAQRRETEAQELLADQRTAIALDLEAQGQFSAARNEFRIALLLDPARAEAREGLTRTRREEQAAEALRKSERQALHGDFEGARMALQEGRALTERQADLFDQAEISLEVARRRLLYEEARAFENDYRYEEAVEAYERLLRETGEDGFFEDAIARMETLQGYIGNAEKLYAEAQAAPDDGQRVRLLRQIEVFWPEYKDVRALLERLGAVEAPR